MNKRVTSSTVGLMVALSGVTWASPALAKEGFSLISAVPSDVFLCTAARHNPERKFVGDYWKEVFDAAKASGVGADVMELIGSQLGDEQKAEVDRLKALATRLIEGVDWDQLCGGEFIFAERMSRLVTEGTNFNMGPPDLVWLIKGSAGSAAKNYDGLVAILGEIVSEVNKAAGEEALALDTTPRMGTRTATLKLTEQSSNEPEFAPTVSLSGEVIVIAIGEKIRSEVLGLLAGKSSATPLAESARFKQAFASLPAAEDSMTFFDAQALMGSVRGIAATVFEAIGESVGGRSAADLSDEARELDTKCIKAYRNKDIAQALTYARKAHEVAPEDARIMYNVACFSALTGKKEEALTWLEKSIDAGFARPNHISKDSDLVSLRDEPRYKAALAKARQKQAEHSTPGDKDVSVAKRIVTRVLDVPAMFDYVASVEYTEGFTTHCETVAVLVEGAAREPFYSVFGKRRPLTRFEKFLPKETTSFSVKAGIDITNLYKFIEDTIRQAGPKGEEILATWAGIQQGMGFDIREDFLGWIDGRITTMTIDSGSGEETVLLVKVTDDNVAREKLATGLTHLSAMLQEMSQQQPMMAMMAIRTTPSMHEKLAGFHNVTIGMQPQPAVCGVAGGYLVIASSADAAALCLETADGNHPNVKENEQLMAEAVIPEGAFASMSFTDKRGLGDKIAEVLGAVGMMGGMAMMAVPSPEGQQILNEALQMLMKLGPVAKKIDFYKSSAEYVTFDGKVWHTRAVTNYQSPAERLARSGN